MLLSAKIANVLYPLFFSLITVAVLLCFIWLMVRFMGKTDEKIPQGENVAKSLNTVGLMLIILLIGLILRLIFVFAVKGYRPDYNVFVRLFENLKSNGFGDNYYLTNDGTTVLPVTYYLYALMGGFYNIFGLGVDSAALSLFVKLPLIAADIVTAFLLYKLTKKYVNEYAALIVAGFVSVFPLFVFASSVWATPFSLLAMFCVLTLYFVASKNYVATIGCYSAAMLTHKDALYLFPLVAVFVIYGLVKASITLHKEKKVSFGELLKDSTVRPVFSIPVSIVGFALASYLLSLPLMIGSFGAGYFTFLYRIYLKPLVPDTVLFGNNSLGIFNLFMRNGKELGARFPSVVFTVLFGVIITGIVLLVYLSKKNRANLVFLAGYIFLTLATYFIGFTEFGLLASVALFITSFLLIRDKRIILVFGVLSIVVMINASAVMANAGYYNNLADYYVGIGSQTNPDYTGSLILGGGMAAVTIVCSVIAVLAHLYSTIVLLDISMSNKRKILPYVENAGFGKALADFCAIKRK